MGYALLWMESLAAALLLVALTTACRERAQMKVLARVAWILALAAPALIGAAETTFASFLVSMRIGDNRIIWLIYTVSWLLCLVFGIAVVAALWPRAIAWPVAIVGAWLAISWLLKGLSLWRGARRGPETDTVTMPRPPGRTKGDGGEG